MPYNATFFAEQGESSHRSALALMPLIVDWLRPTSVIDIGCGLGAWAASALAKGVPDVVAVDGAYVDRSQLLVPPESFVESDLTLPFRSDQRFDVALSLEVAEHLPPERSGSFVDDLCALSDVVVFSAAVPGQLGTHHINLRWQSYWATLFEDRGFTVFDSLRPLIWKDERIEWWYRQNIFVASTHPLPSLGGLQLLDVVHPDPWLALQSDIGLRMLFRRIPAAARASAAYHLRRRLRPELPSAR